MGSPCLSWLTCLSQRKALVIFFNHLIVIAILCTACYASDLFLLEHRIVVADFRWLLFIPVGIVLFILIPTTDSLFSGNGRLVLSTVIRHLDHKNVVNHPQMKADIIQSSTSLVCQLRSRGVVAEMGVVTDLCRHLRKCLEAIGHNGSGIEESNWNESLQNSIEDCLLEIVKGV